MCEDGALLSSVQALPRAWRPHLLHLLRWWWRKGKGHAGACWWWCRSSYRLLWGCFVGAAWLWGGWVGGWVSGRITGDGGRMPQPHRAGSGGEAERVEVWLASAGAGGGGGGCIHALQRTRRPRAFGPCPSCPSSFQDTRSCPSPDHTAPCTRSSQEGGRRRCGMSVCAKYHGHGTPPNKTRSVPEESLKYFGDSSTHTTDCLQASLLATDSLLPSHARTQER